MQLFRKAPKRVLIYFTSYPAAQWDSARSLAFMRRPIFLYLILPQCARRMPLPWMNRYALIAMSTSLLSMSMPVNSGV